MSGSTASQSKNGLFKGKYWLMVITSIISSVATVFLMLAIVPNAKQTFSGSDAVSIANTYIVFTTLIVTAFAVLAAFASVYLAQITQNSKFLEFQVQIYDKILDDKNFIERIETVAKSNVTTAVASLKTGSDNFDALVARVKEEILVMYQNQQQQAQSLASFIQPKTN